MHYKRSKIDEKEYLRNKSKPHKSGIIHEKLYRAVFSFRPCPLTVEEEIAIRRTELGDFIDD